MSDALTVTSTVAGFGGCLLVTAWGGQEPARGIPAFSGSSYGLDSLVGLVLVFCPLLAVVAGLLLARWWPALLLCSAGLMLPGLTAEATSLGHLQSQLWFCCSATGYPLAIIGVLACASSLVERQLGLAAGIAAMVFGASALSDVLYWAISRVYRPGIDTLVSVLTVLGGLAQLGVLAWSWVRPAAHRDAAEEGLARSWLPRSWLPRSWRDWRVLLAAGGAMCLAVPQAVLDHPSSTSIIRMFAVTRATGADQRYLQTVVMGSIIVVAVVAMAAVAGFRSLAATMTVALAQVAVSVPIGFALWNVLYRREPNFAATAWCVLAGVAVGVLAAASRWRVPLAAALSVVAMVVLLIADSATSGRLGLLGDPARGALPLRLLLACLVASATAVMGATVPILVDRVVLPAVLGPLVLVATAGGRLLFSVVRLRNEPGARPGGPGMSRTELQVSAVLLFVVAVMVAGIGLGQHLAARAAERKQAAEIKREAAAAERERLARSIHDGVLQVLALVQHSGSELGERGSQLAALAGQQEVALRNLLSGGTQGPAGSDGDLRQTLLAMASPVVEVNAPAESVSLPGHTVAEVTAAVGAALDNVTRHAGAGARAWVLLEDEGDAVRVTVRDDGVGFAPPRLDAAAAAGRMGVAKSMRGRIEDLGGTTTILSSPGQGVEVEFLVPRQR